MSNGAGETLLVYRHRLAPRSEVGFLRRFYLGFEHLTPAWVGCYRADGVGQLTDHPLILGRSGPLGAIDRTLFRQFGIVPPQPDLRSLKPRLIHAHFGRGGALALPLARALGVPLVVTFHGSDATKETHYQHRLVPHIFARRLPALQREASLFVCVSDFVRERLIARGFPPEKLDVIYQGVDMTVGENEKPPQSAPYALFVGRFVEKKGVRHLIDAMSILERRKMELGLVLIGDGPLAPELKQRAQGLNQAWFLGWQPNQEVRRWMRGAVAVCVPSVTAQSGDSEGLPTVIFEAMAEGVPVIGSRHAGIAEAVEHQQTGILVPPADPTALAEALAGLVAAPEMQLRLGLAARVAASERFDVTRQSRRLEEALLRVLAEHAQ
jgi:glycosyltransferase involved in cell wall biosynthesis